MTISVSFPSVQQNTQIMNFKGGSGQWPIGHIAFGSVVRQYILVRVCDWLLPSQRLGSPRVEEEGLLLPSIPNKPCPQSSNLLPLTLSQRSHHLSIMLWARNLAFDILTFRDTYPKHSTIQTLLYNIGAGAYFLGEIHEISQTHLFPFSVWFLWSDFLCMYSDCRVIPVLMPQSRKSLIYFVLLLVGIKQPRAFSMANNASQCFQDLGHWPVSGDRNYS